MPHPARRQIRSMDVSESGLCARVLFGVVVFPFDVDGAVEADAVQLDHDLLHAVGVAGTAGRHEVPAIEGVAHRPMPAQKPGPGMLPAHLHSLDVSAMDEVAELTDELDYRDALPFHVRA